MSRYNVADRADEFWDMLIRGGVVLLNHDNDTTFNELSKKFYEIIEASGWDSPLETRVGEYLAMVDDESCYKFNHLDYCSSEEQIREEFEDFDELERLVEVWKKFYGN